LGKIYKEKPLVIKDRRELLASIRPNHRKYLRLNTGDLPEHTDALRFLNTQKNI